MGFQGLDGLGHPGGLGGDLVEVDGIALELVQAHADARGLGGAHNLDIDDIDTVQTGARLQGVDDVLLQLALDHATPLFHEKGARANPHFLHVTTSFACVL